MTGIVKIAARGLAEDQDADEYRSLRDRMRELRTSVGMTQAKFAAVLGLRGQSTYYELECGPTMVRRGDLAAIAQYLGLSLAEAFPTYKDPLEGDAPPRPDIAPCSDCLEQAA